MDSASEQFLCPGVHCTAPQIKRPFLPNVANLPLSLLGFQIFYGVCLFSDLWNDNLEQAALVCGISFIGPTLSDVTTWNELSEDTRDIFLLQFSLRKKKTHTHTTHTHFSPSLFGWSGQTKCLSMLYFLIVFGPFFDC